MPPAADIPFQPSTLAGFATILACIAAAQGLVLLTRTGGTQAPGRLQNLDGLRGLLALFVFVGHLVAAYYYHVTGVWGTPPIRFYARAGSIGVALFFMVTGFLFWSRMLARRGRLDWVSLYLSRVFRIVPLYWFMAFLVFGVVLWAGGAALNVPLRALRQQILIWLSFFDYPDINKFRGTVLIVAGVIWTLKYEWIFYLLLPLQALIVRFSERFPWSLWALAGLAVWISIDPLYIGALQITTQYAVYFLGGAIAAWLYPRGQFSELVQKPWMSLLALMALFLAFALYEMDFAFSQAIFLGLFFIPIALGNSLFGILNRKPVVLLGEISYSVYLLHGILIYVVFSVLFPGLIASLTHPFQFYAIMITLGLILVFLCWATYRLLEKPFIHLGKWIDQRRAPGARRQAKDA